MNSPTRRSSILSFAVVFALTPIALALQVQKPVIERLDLRGNRRYSEETIRSYVSSRPGGLLDAAKLKHDVGALRGTGFFEQVEVTEKDGDIGKIVTFTVVEKPWIAACEFVGFKSLQRSAIESYWKQHHVDFRVGSPYDDSKLKSASQALERLIAEQGWQAGKVRTEVSKLGPDVGIRFIFGEKAT